MQVKLRASITFELEYEAEPSDYIVKTIEEVCKIDLEAWKDNPNLLMLLGRRSVKVEEVHSSIGT